MLMTRRLPPFWLCQPTPRWLMPPRLLWSPYLRCSPQMLRMRLPVWLMLLPLRL
ncbi:virulence protein MsgA, partial [Salmonella enterica subsp. enterica serovar Typhimurium]|nr:virulence protein MsgA [Salmonella enterica subsp. enterica serovar Typhimurium]